MRSIDARVHPAGFFLLDVEVDHHPSILNTWREAGRPVPPPIVVPALVDTGSNVTLAVPDLIGELGLPLLNEARRTLHTAAGPQATKTYIARLRLPGVPGF